MKTNQNLKFLPKKPLAVLVGMLLSAPTLVWAAEYSSVPLSLTSAQSRVAPNVLLFIDNSGSMQDSLPNTRTTKASVAQSAAKTVIANHRDLRWGLASFGGRVVNSSSGPFAGAQIRRPIANIDENNNSNFTALTRAIDNLSFNTGTPSTSAFYELTRYFRGMSSAYSTANGQYGNYTSPIEYRCQKNFVVFISDGQPNTTSWYTNIYPNSSYSTNGIYRRTPLAQYTSARSYDSRGNLTNNSRNARLTINDQSYQPLGIAAREAGTGGTGAFGLTRSGQAFEHSNSTLITGAREQNEIYACSQNNSCAMYTELGMSHFTRLAHNQDLITSDMNLGYGSGRDIEGGNFDEAGQFGKQSIETFTIGFGEDIPMMEYAAKEGGGAYYMVDSASGLDEAIDAIANSIALASAPFTGVAPAVVSSATSDGVTVSGAQVLSLNTVNWSSQLRFYDVTNNAITEFTRPSYNPADSVSVISTANGIQSLDSSNSQLNNATFSLNSSNSNQWANLVQWLTRRAGNDSDTGYRDRTTLSEHDRFLGDVLGSNLMAMGILNRTPYSTTEYLSVGSNDGMLHVYKREGQADNAYRDVFQYIPGLAKNQAGETINERLQNTAAEGYGAGSAGTHQNLVDGEISWHETTGDSNSRVYMTGLLGKGGRAAFALNIAGTDSNSNAVGLDTPSNTWLNNVPLWDTSTSGVGNAQTGVDGIIGHTFGTAFNGRVALEGSIAAKQKEYVSDMRYATALGSGFDPAMNADGSYPTPSVFVLDSLGINAGANSDGTFLDAAISGAKPGTLLKQITVPSTLADNISTTAPKGLTSPTGLDIDGDGVWDALYAGDQNGNVYRFDLRAEQSQWNAEIIFKGSSNQPITGQPNVYRNPRTKRVTVLFGTGSELYSGDLTSTTQQRFYGIMDPLDDDPAVAGDLSTKSATAGYPMTPTSNTLLEQTYSQSGTGTNIERILNTQATFNLNTNTGWFVNLTNNGVQQGERVVTMPEVGGTRRGASVLFSTKIFQPAETSVQQSCTATETTSTSGFLMTLHAETGGRPITLHFDQDRLEWIGQFYAANLSAPKLVTQNTNDQSLFGGSRSGKSLPLNTEVNLEGDCSRDQVTAGIGDDQSGASFVTFGCPTKVTANRISWRELFN